MVKRYVKDEAREKAVEAIVGKMEPPKPEPVYAKPQEPDVSLDDIANRIVLALDRATKHLLESVSAGDVSREVIGALKDCEAMHRELAKKEKDFLDNASDEQLEKMLKK